LKTYISYLDKYAEPFSNKQELSRIVEKVKKGRRWFILALRHFFNFLEERDYVDEIELMRLRKVIPVPKTGAQAEYPPTEEVIRGYHVLEDEDDKLLYELLVYSGIRLDEGFILLKTFDPAKLTKVNDKVYRYELVMERGTKRSFNAYLPAFFVPKLRRLREDYTYDMAKKRLNLKEKGVNITAKKLRKWSDNFLVECGVPDKHADFIQGRAKVTVGSKHYLEMVRHADRWYTTVVDKLPRFENLSIGAITPLSSRQNISKL